MKIAPHWVISGILAIGFSAVLGRELYRDYGRQPEMVRQLCARAEALREDFAGDDVKALANPLFQDVLRICARQRPLPE
jgi:hypothetical protein